jgi:hypothetical protein
MEHFDDFQKQTTRRTQPGYHSCQGSSPDQEAIESTGIKRSPKQGLHEEELGEG